MAAFCASGGGRKETQQCDKNFFLKGSFCLAYHNIWYLIDVTVLYNGLRRRLSPRKHKLSTGFNPETGSY